MSTREWLSSRPTELFNELAAWLLKGAPAPAPPVLKMLTVEAYVKWASSPNFVETGTHEGVTTGYISSIVKRAISIELSSLYYEKSKSMLKEFKNIELHQGDSAKLMQSIVTSLEGITVFWLDGHYSGGETAMGTRVSPLLEELTSIFVYGPSDAILLIDDARLFDGIEYPSISLLSQMAQYYWPECELETLHDIMRIVPRHLVSVIAAARDQSSESNVSFL